MPRNCAGRYQDMGELRSKALALNRETIETGEFFKSGARKGKPRKKITVKAEPDKDTEIQLNHSYVEAAGSRKIC